MKINTEAQNIYTSQQTQVSATTNTNSTSFSSALEEASGETSGVKQADFTSMTRQEMFDWMNGQIRDGKMSLDESSSFLGMTMKISATTGEPVDMGTDTTRINFIEKAQLGIEGALENNDQNLAEKLRMAVEIMRGNNG